MILIFYFSSQVATDSNEISTGVTVFIRKIIIGVFTDLNISVQTLNHFIRKSAHFGIYFGLGFLLKSALYVSKYKGFKGSNYALITSGLYAISDEFHQVFVPNRGPGIIDVIIDTGGALTGILVFITLLKITKVLKSRCWYLQKISEISKRTYERIFNYYMNSYNNATTE